MGEKWTDKDERDYDARCQRIEEAQHVLAPSLTPAQQAELAREAEADAVKLDRVGLALLERRVAEQSALITGQRAAIEELRGWIQECADGVSNLGMRVAKLEDACKARDARQRELAGDIITNLEGKSARLNRLEAQADKCVRFQAIHPPVTEEDNDE